MNRFVGPRGSSCSRAFAGLLVLLAGFSTVATAATYGGGAGTIDDPYLILTAEQFVTIGKTPADWNKGFRLMNDIDLAGYDQTNLDLIGRWVVAGSPDNLPFNGMFDGNGKTIRGFQYRDMTSQYVGLFRYVTGQIVNVCVAGAKVTANGVGAGALVGYLEKGGISGCSADQVTVSGSEGVGGLVGAVDSTVYTSWSSGKVLGNRHVGGLVGWLGGGRVTRSYSKATVMADDGAGGLVGICSRSTGVVDYCYAAGNVKGGLYAGGLVGQLSGMVSWCYSRGKVTGQAPVGGLIGERFALAEVMSSFWDTEASGQATSFGGVGKTTAEMMSIDTYLPANWDFGGIWSICDGLGYPILMWQIPRGDLRCPDGVNFTDFVWFAAGWRHTDCGAGNYSCEGADLDGDADVDLLDLTIFSANWMAGVEW